ncbi:hypothetical protein Gotur_030872 [Gossypium turneri]
MNKSLAIMPYLYFDSVMTPDDFKIFSFIVMDPERASTGDVESNVPSPAEGTVPPDGSERPITISQGRRARKAFFQAMNEWFAEFVRMNPAIRPPPFMIFSFPM